MSKGINPIIDIDSGWSRVYDYDRLSISGLLKLPFGDSQNIVIYKSHLPFRKHMNPCIVLTRDPRESITSHYRFLCERGNNFNMNFEDSFKLAILTLMNTVNSSMYGLSNFDF